jgi:hypothetical protein
MGHHLQLGAKRCAQRRNAFVNYLKRIVGVLCPFSSLEDEEQGSLGAGASEVLMQCLPLFGKRRTHQPLKAVPPDGIKDFGWSRERNPGTRRSTVRYQVYASNHLCIQATSLVIHLVDHAVAPQRFPLFHLPLIAHCEFVPSLCPAPRENLAAILCRHSLSEPVCVFPFPFVWLKRAFHSRLTPPLFRKLRLKQKKRVAHCRTILPFGSSSLLVLKATKKLPDKQHLQRLTTQ